MRIPAASFAFVLLLGGCAAASDGLRQTPPPTETVTVEAQRYSSDYHLGAGDKVRVTVYDETDLSGEFQVDGSGYVRLPLVGQVKAGGRTARQLEGDVSGALADGYLKNPRVAVEVTTYRPFYIIGQVNRPGQYPYTSNMSPIDAVGVAGGFTDHAVESTLHIRHEGETRELDVPADETVKIQPGGAARGDQTAFWAVSSWLSPATSVAMPLAFAPSP